MILERMETPYDVKQLNDSEAQQLCEELRTFLVNEVSKTGGHLASNLGVVELTVAIHRVFDTSRDRLVFDVGHQCYVHKALTGRKALFDTLRQFGGLSGFPKPYESRHDAFIAGHASNSVSVALGMAKARTLQGEDYSVLALIGDGAMTGGLSFEGLNNAGASGEPLIVILNDNGMSIDPNVGAVSRYLQNLRNRPGYYEFKKQYREALSSNAVGRKLYSASHDIKTTLKKSILPESSMFEDMGFTYMGPVNGHDIIAVTEALKHAKEQTRPVLLHVHTVKGKGYDFAEKDPGKFHGIGAFDPKTGELKKPAGETFSSVFGQELAELAQEDPAICTVTAAMVDGTGLTPFARRFPRRFTDVGIAEEHAVAMAAGMATQGLKPVVAIYSSFLQRAYDQLLHDVSLSGAHVVFGVDRAGLVGADGETHHGVFDVQYLSTVPGMTVLCPSSFAELREMLRSALWDYTTPVAIRYPRGGEGIYTACCGKEELTELRPGSNGTILSYGILINEALSCAELLHQRGIEVRVVKLNKMTPLPTKILADALGDTDRLLIAEDCIAVGCVGQRVAAALAACGKSPKQLMLRNLGDMIPHQGSVSELYRTFALDAQSLAETMEEMIHEQ